MSTRRAHETTARLAAKIALARGEQLTPDEATELAQAREEIMDTPAMRTAESDIATALGRWWSAEVAGARVEIQASIAELESKIAALESEAEGGL